MTYFDASAATQDFSFSNGADSLRFVSEVNATATEYSWLTLAFGGHLVTATGDFTYSGGNVSGTVSSIKIDLSNNGNTDVAIDDTNNADISLLLLGRDTFWETLFSESDTFVGSQTVAGSIVGDILSSNTNSVGSDDIFSAVISGGRFHWTGDQGGFTGTGIFSGGDDVFTVSGNVSGISSIDGDIGTLSNTETYTGGNDVMNIGALTHSSIPTYFVGDVSALYGTLYAGNDTITVASFVDETNVYGDVRTFGNQIFGLNAVLFGGDDMLSGGSDIYGDSSSLFAGSLTGGHDIITAGSIGSNIFGDIGTIRDSTDAASVFVGGNDDITGLAGVDRLYGDIWQIEAGATITNITFGDDTINGGGGDDEIWGDFKDDFAGVLSATAGGIDTINGGAGDDIIYGNGGDDIINGDADNDTIDGGTGADTMRGGTGNDSFVVDTGGDVVEEFLDEGTDSVSSSITYTLTNHVENLTLTGDGNGFGNTSDNILTGSSGFYNSLFGEAGNDILTLVSALGGYADGGIGVDTVNGGTGGDRLYGGTRTDYLNGGGGNDQIYGESGNDFLHGNGGEDVLEGGAGRDILHGDELDDRLFGGDDTDVLYGGTGNDRLNGESGNDTLYGDAGEDLLDGGIGSDSLNGGDDDDRLYGGTEGDNLHGDGGNDRLFGEDGIDYVYGDDGIDVVEGGADGDFLFGGTGTDRLYGDAGDDELNGGAEADWLFGMDDNDILKGDGGDDVIDGGLGADILFGGFGDDRLYGGGGADSYFFADTWGIDKVYGYEAGETLDFQFVTGLTNISQLNIITVGLDIQMSFGSDLLILDGAASVFSSADVIV